MSCFYASFTLVLQCISKSNSVMCYALFHLLKSTWALWGRLWFHMNFYCFYEAWHWHFNRDCIESVPCLGSWKHLNTIIPSNPHARDIFNLFVTSSVSFINAYSFQCMDLSPTWLNLFLFHFSEAIVNGNFFLDSVLCNTF